MDTSSVPSVALSFLWLYQFPHLYYRIFVEMDFVLVTSVGV